MSRPSNTTSETTSVSNRSSTCKSKNKLAGAVPLFELGVRRSVGEELGLFGFKNDMLKFVGAQHGKESGLPVDIV